MLAATGLLTGGVAASNGTRISSALNPGTHGVAWTVSGGASHQMKYRLNAAVGGLPVARARHNHTPFDDLDGFEVGDGPGYGIHWSNKHELRMLAHNNFNQHLSSTGGGYTIRLQVVLPEYPQVQASGLNHCRILDWAGGNGYLQYGVPESTGRIGFLVDWTVGTGNGTIDVPNKRRTRSNPDVNSAWRNDPLPTDITICVEPTDGGANHRSQVLIDGTPTAIFNHVGPLPAAASDFLIGSSELYSLPNCDYRLFHLIPGAMSLDGRFDELRAMILADMTEAGIERWYPTDLSHVFVIDGHSNDFGVQPDGNAPDVPVLAGVQRNMHELTLDLYETADATRYAWWFEAYPGKQWSDINNAANRARRKAAMTPGAKVLAWFSEYINSTLLTDGYNAAQNVSATMQAVNETLADKPAAEVLVRYPYYGSWATDAFITDIRTGLDTQIAALGSAQVHKLDAHVDLTNADPLGIMDGRPSVHYDAGGGDISMRPVYTGDGKHGTAALNALQADHNFARSRALVTPAVLPDPPAAPIINVGAGTVTITIPAVAGATQYEYRVDGGAPASIDAATATPVPVDDATEPHTIEARAGNAGGWGPWALVEVGGGEELTLPPATDVRSGIDRGDGTLGTLAVPAAADVRVGTAVAATVGTLAVPTAAQVLAGVAVGATVGTVTLPAAADVESGVQFGAGGNQYTGSLVAEAGSGSTIRLVRGEGEIVLTPLSGGSSGTINAFVGDQFGIVLRLSDELKQAIPLPPTATFTATVTSGGTVITAAGECEVLYAAGGVLEYRLSEDDTAAPGRYSLTVKLHDADAEDDQTFGPVVLTVRTP
jgi:hypothetical protein